MKKLGTKLSQMGAASWGVRIPKTIRDMLELEPGNKFEIYVDDHKGEEVIIVREIDDGK